MGLCKYLLSKNNGIYPGLPEFAVWAKNYPRDKPGISNILWVEVEYKNMLIHMQKKEDKSSAPVIVTVRIVETCSVLEIE